MVSTICSRRALFSEVIGSIMGSRTGAGSIMDASVTGAAITVASRAETSPIMTSVMFACFLAMRLFDGAVSGCVRVVRSCGSLEGETFMRSVVWQDLEGRRYGVWLPILADERV